MQTWSSENKSKISIRKLDENIVSENLFFSVKRTWLDMICEDQIKNANKSQNVKLYDRFIAPT